ncbi:hypothetical protein [Acidithiobacillus sp.]|jgi:hypothetical protein|uniref:hypothetical protein n=1 Tax=Acidithiobacillus sp. TaxID=1872118 RepID=UPI0025BE87AC|nr:hypothetical protein [Acidithiobacillus sp.]MCK9187867.1 hypothetical protein [Acidithiobacillus sp.]MCK9359826.1 hypothetical protein [Acidithiobacillus sp.]
MALRLIEMVLQEKDGAELRDLLKEHQVLEHQQLRLPDGEVLVRILLDAERNGTKRCWICWRIGIPARRATGLWFCPSKRHCRVPTVALASGALAFTTGVSTTLIEG